MYCSQCGANGADGNFCEVCGAPLHTPVKAGPPQGREAPIEPMTLNTQPASPQPVNAQPVNAQPVNAQPVNAQPTYTQPTPPQPANTQPVTPQPVNAQPVNTPPAGAPSAYTPNMQNSGSYTIPSAPVPTKKKGHAGAVVLVLLVLIAVACFAFGGGLSRFASPTKMYQKIEQNNLATITAHTENFAQFAGKGSDTSLLLTLTDDGKTLLSDDMDMSWLNNISMNINSAKDDANSYSYSTLNINDTKILDIETLSALAGKDILLRLPDISPLFVTMGGDNSYMKFLGNMTPDMDAVNKVINRYGEIVIDHLDQVEKTKETVTVGSTSAEYTALVVTIDSETYDAIQNEIAQTAREDRDIEALIRASAQKDGRDPDEAYASFLAELDDRRDEGEAEENTVLSTMTVYLDKKGEVCGRRIVSSEEPDTATYYLTAWDGKNFETEIRFDDGDTPTVITGSGSRSGNKISGEYTVYAGDVHVATLLVEDFDKKAAKAGEINATVTYTPGKDYLDETDQNPLSAGLCYRIDVASKAGKLDATVTILSDVTELASLKIGSKANTNKNVPSVGDDEKVDLQTWVNSIDTDQALQTISDSLRAAGMPEEYLD